MNSMSHLEHLTIYLGCVYSISIHFVTSKNKNETPVVVIHPALGFWNVFRAHLFVFSTYCTFYWALKIAVQPPSIHSWALAYFFSFQGLVLRLWQMWLVFFEDTGCLAFPLTFVRVVSTATGNALLWYNYSLLQLFQVGSVSFHFSLNHFVM